MAFAGISVGRTRGSLKFVKRSEDYQGGALYQYYLPYTPPAGLPPSNFEFVSQEVFIEDIRGKEAEFSIERQGFCLCPFSTQMPYAEYDDTKKIRDILYPEVKEVLQRLTGASMVDILSHVVRGKHAGGRKPSEEVHIDVAESWRANLFESYCRKSDANIAPSQKYEFYKYMIHLHAVLVTPG
ncbi:hypothetical protein AnigIFM60653_007694 [Aspergillus niger]|nr:hypothetical protein AnigIFM60653_007694 [Aspergillus niger]